MRLGGWKTARSGCGSRVCAAPTPMSRTASHAPPATPTWYWPARSPRESTAFAASWNRLRQLRAWPMACPMWSICPPRWARRSTRWRPTRCCATRWAKSLSSCSSPSSATRSTRPAARSRTSTRRSSPTPSASGSAMSCSNFCRVRCQLSVVSCHGQRTTMAEPLLEVDSLSKSFAGVHALEDYSLRLEPLMIHGVIGPNGAGKTTLFNLLTGFMAPTAGTIRFQGRNITRQPAYRVARLGIASTFQNIRLFGQLSVLENIKTALQIQSPSHIVSTLLSAPRFLRRERELSAQAIELLERVGLAARRDQLARNLPYGDQRRVEIARAVALKPKILLLDEPNAGMNPNETVELLALIRRLRDELAITIIMVAHDIPLVMNLCDRIQVLNYGRLIAEGDPATVRNNPEVIVAYLGSVSSQ